MRDAPLPSPDEDEPLRAVSVLEVADVRLWDELEAMVPLDAHLGPALGPRRRVVHPSFEREVLPELVRKGTPVLLRYARRSPETVRQATERFTERVARLTTDARLRLHAAQRHALDDVVLGGQVWDPEHDGAFVRELMGAETVAPLAQPEGEPAWSGRFLLNPDLPPPPALAWDFEEAILPEPEDLELHPQAQSPVALLHDLASLAAALLMRPVRRTHAGTVTRADARWLGRRLGSESLGDGGQVEAEPRWARALRGLELLGAVSMDPVTRELFVDLGLDAVLAGTTAEAVDRLIRKVVDRDLQALLPAVRTSLAEAGEGAVDDVVFLDLVREQHRDVVFRAWHRRGVALYPSLGEATLRRFDDDGFDDVEAPMVRALLSRLHRLGLIRRAPGVFAATADGRLWAGATGVEAPPIWISSDLEMVVPPHALTPWERLQIERLCVCVGRDVVDRYRLDREGLVGWLATHDLDEALALLDRRSPNVPSTVPETLASWAASAQRVVLTRGVLL